MLGYLLMCLVLLNHNSCDCSKILAVIPMPSYSHQFAFQEIWSELSLRGHQVTLLTTFPVQDKSLTNLTEINLMDMFEEDIWKTFDGDNMLQALDNGVLKTMEFLTQLILLTSETIMKNEYFQNLIHQKEEKFDVVFVESYFPEFYVLGKIFKCPVIGVTSMEASTDVHMLMGNPTHPVSHSDIVLPVYNDLNILERIVSTIYNNLISLHRSFVSNPAKQKLLDKYIHIPADIEDLRKNLDMVFFNAHPLLQKVRSLGPASIPIGGTTHIKKPKDLPKDIQMFMNKSSHGVIYFSLGTNVKSKSLKPEILEKLLTTFNNTQYDILWKFEGNITNLPKNVMIVNWAPQQDIFRHPKIKLFITQGGLISFQEAVVFEIPMIVFPFFGDQMHNAKNIEHKKIGKYFHHKSFDQMEFQQAINEVIQDPKYKSNIIALKQLIMDDPMSSVEKAIWWTEYIIRHKGGKHLRNPIVDLPWYQYHMLDVYGILVLICFLMLFLLKKCTQVVFGLGFKVFKLISGDDKVSRTKKVK